MKITTLMLTLILVSADAQEIERYPEYVAADDHSSFWQLTMVTQTELIDISPEMGFAFLTRVSCIKDGIRRMQDAAEPRDEVWDVSPLLGFVCEYMKNGRD